MAMKYCCLLGISFQIKHKKTKLFSHSKVFCCEMQENWRIPAKFNFAARCIQLFRERLSEKNSKCTRQEFVFPLRKFFFSGLANRPY